MASIIAIGVIIIRKITVTYLIANVNKSDTTPKLISPFIAPSKLIAEFVISFSSSKITSLSDTNEISLSAISSPIFLNTSPNRVFISNTVSIKKYEQYGIYPNAVKLDILKMINSTLYKPLFEFLDNSYLNKKQLKLITSLILLELENNIKSDIFDWQDKSTYIPSILIYKELKEHLEHILLHTSDYFSTEIQRSLSHKIISSVINIDKSGTARTTFLIEDTLSFMMIDLQKYLTGTKTVLTCQNCGRLFYPKSNKNKTYCQLKHKDTHLLCNEIAHRQSKDEFAKKCKTAKGNQKGFVDNAIALENNPKFQYNYQLLHEAYEQWKIDASIQMEYFRSINDLDGFEKWISDTKFTTQKLEELGIRKRIKQKL